MLRRLARMLIGRAALASYSTVATLAWVPQLDGARQWALQTTSSWAQQLPAVRDVQHWLGQSQGTLSSWKQTLQTLAHQSRTLSHPQPPAASTESAPNGGAATDKTQRSSPDFAQCAEQIPSSAPLDVASVGTRWLPVALCSDGFAVLYSGLSKTPIVTIERLNRTRLKLASAQKRTDHFYADARLRDSYKAALADYQGSGYDRGHMAPAADQHTPVGMAQSFALSNMVPQNPTNNRQVWAKLEGNVRQYAQRASGNVFVYTGPLFDNTAQTIGSSRVWVPSYLYKLVFDEQQQRAWGWVLPNTANAQLGKPMDYASFVERTGRNFLPQLR